MSGSLSDMMSQSLWDQLRRHQQMTLMQQQNAMVPGGPATPALAFGVPNTAASAAPGAAASPLSSQASPFAAGGIDLRQSQSLYGTMDPQKLGMLGSFGFPIPYDPRLLGRRRPGGGGANEGNQAGDHAGDPSGPEGPGGGGLG